MTRADGPEAARAVPAQQSQALTCHNPAVHDRPPHTLAGRAEAAAIQLRPSIAAQSAPRGGISAIVAILVHAIKVVKVIAPGIIIRFRP